MDRGSGLSRLARGVATVVLDALLPPRCATCDEPVDRPGSLCLQCWSGLTFVTRPLCAVCGDPFETAPPGEPVCGDCLAGPPPWGRGRSALRYDDASRPLVLGFKHGDRLHLASLLAGWMRAAGAELMADADVIVPVPLHRWRLLARRYNQAAVLAHALGRATGIPVSDRALQRVKRTPSQGRLTRSQRARNVQGAFRVAASRRTEVAGRRVLLVDDVLTSGATAGACARVLLRAGVEAVDLLTLARVV
ncbi:ComF family protein [Thalassobaculum sp.]|uniref:ComF family protein n=1 Tax=Thalassobaculum sp. TaxID=2022740 RepID=UPI0032EEC231